MNTENEITEYWKMGMLDALASNDQHNRNFLNLSQDYWDGYTKGEEIRERDDAREFFMKHPHAR